MAYVAYIVIYEKKDYYKTYIESDTALDNATNPDKLMRKIYYVVMFLFFTNLFLNLL